MKKLKVITDFSITYESPDHIVSVGKKMIIRQIQII